MKEPKTEGLEDALKTDKENFDEESSIKKEGESNGKFTTDILNKNDHYYCPNCHSFPLICFKENKIINIKCKDSDNDISLQNYLNFKVTKGEIQNFVINNLNKKYTGYCFVCKQFFCENNSKDHEEHNIKDFQDIINFIIQKLNQPKIIQVKEEEKSEIPEIHNITSKKSEIGDTIKFEEKNGRYVQKTNNDNIDNKYLNDPFEGLIKMIIEDSKSYPSNTHYENIKNIFYYLSDTLEIEYHSYENQSSEIRIFGENFFQNNAKNFILFIDEKEEILKEIIKVKDPKKTLKIKLIKINEPTDLSEMFYKCDCLSKIKIINTWKTPNVESISGMFNGCRALEELPDISKWVTNKITDLSSMFEECISLVSIPNISKWDVENVTTMRDIFKGCESLESLDLSGWTPNNLKVIESMFQDCNNLNSLKGLDQFDTSKVTSMNNVFQNCKTLIEITGIDEWNIENVTSFSNMFDGCESLKELPDLSKWETKNATKMDYMFSNCTNLEKIQYISKWNVENVINMNSMFENCSNLNSFPDKLEWKLNPKLDKYYIFNGCDLLNEKPL